MTQTTDMSKSTGNDVLVETGIDAHKTLAELHKSIAQIKVGKEADALQAFQAKLERIEPLSADEQDQLARKYVNDGDITAGKLLVLTNLRLVVKLAAEYRRRATNFIELIQQGNLGLAEALTRFDPSKGVKFTSYAQYWIRAMVLNYLMNQTHIVRVTGTRAGRKLFYNLKKARRLLSRRGLKPTPENVAAYLDVKPKQVARISVHFDEPPVQLDAPARGHENTTVGELLENEQESPENEALRRRTTRRLREAFEAFGNQIDDERKHAIWHERMVLDREDRKTLTDLGDDWGVSKERIRQVEVSIRKDFREFLEDHYPEICDVYSSDIN